MSIPQPVFNGIAGALAQAGCELRRAHETAVRVASQLAQIHGLDQADVRELLDQYVLDSAVNGNGGPLHARLARLLDRLEREAAEELLCSTTTPTT